MNSGTNSIQVRSLAAARAGEIVQIRRILFGALRHLCDELGIREGDVVTCRAGTPSHLLLQTRNGRTTALERDWTRFIQVTTPVVEAAPGPTTRRAPGALC